VIPPECNIYAKRCGLYRGSILPTMKRLRDKLTFFLKRFRFLLPIQGSLRDCRDVFYLDDLLPNAGQFLACKEKVQQPIHEHKSENIFHVNGIVVFEYIQLDLVLIPFRSTFQTNDLRNLSARLRELLVYDLRRERLLDLCHHLTSLCKK